MSARDIVVSVGDLSKNRAAGAYHPVSGELTLDRASIARMSPERRAELVRHEVAHKIEFESGLWMRSDTVLWEMWEQDKHDPVFLWASEQAPLQPWRGFNNAKSPEIIAQLYATAYESGRMEYFDPSSGYVEAPIPAALMDILRDIDKLTGIYAKRKQRSGNRSPT